MQAYDNMIDLMVDSFRLCSDLSRDVLVWCLLQNLASFDGSKLGKGNYNRFCFINCHSLYVGANDF